VTVISATTEAYRVEITVDCGVLEVSVARVHAWYCLNPDDGLWVLHPFIATPGYPPVSNADRWVDEPDYGRFVGVHCGPLVDIDASMRAILRRALERTGQRLHELGASYVDFATSTAIVGWIPALAEGEGRWQLPATTDQRRKMLLDDLAHNTSTLAAEFHKRQPTP